MESKNASTPHTGYTHSMLMNAEPGLDSFTITLVVVAVVDVLLRPGVAQLGAQVVPSNIS